MSNMVWKIDGEVLKFESVEKVWNFKMENVYEPWDLDKWVDPYYYFLFILSFL